MEAAYQGLAVIGSVKSAMSLVWPAMWCVPVLLIGMYLMLYTGTLSATVQGRVTTEPICGTEPPADETCIVKVAFRIPGETVDRTVERSVRRRIVTEITPDGTTVVHVMPLDYVDGQTVTMYYDPQRPTETIDFTNKDDWRLVGTIIAVVAGLYLLRAGLHYVFSRKFTAYAALGGAGVVGSAAANVLHANHTTTTTSVVPATIVVPTHPTHHRWSHHGSHGIHRSLKPPPPPPAKPIIRINHQHVKPTVRRVVHSLKGSISGRK
jgi:multidrug transporter EmrE-like cation transporter